MNKSRVWRTDADTWEKMKPLAREKRAAPTEAEQILWPYLRNGQAAGHKFRRQFSIERFIVDFYCAEANLVIEVDGLIHLYKGEEDRIRQAFIAGQGLRILRFPNDEVVKSPGLVVKRILRDLTLNPSPSTEREA